MSEEIKQSKEPEIKVEKVSLKEIKNDKADEIVDKIMEKILKIK